MLESSVWPRHDYSRVPYRFYHDEEIYRTEQDRIFRGPAWCFLGLEAEIPNPGDFRTTWIGDMPIICHRDRDGTVHALLNRCAHRGALVRREMAGNAEGHTCIYHQWRYGTNGCLLSIPFRRGVGGKGGLARDFDMGAHGLRRMEVANVSGALFGTFAGEHEDIEDYLGPDILGQIRRLLHKPIRILGYHRQVVRGNWKMFAENTRDNYHASLLHEFLVTFDLDRSTQTGGVTMDARHRHNITYAKMSSETEEQTARRLYGEVGVRHDRFTLRDPSMVAFRREREDDDFSLSVTSVFPNANFVQISNSLAVRQIRPKGIDRFEVFQTLFGYEDDAPELTKHRLHQANLVGPAGLVSMEDGEAVEIAHNGSRGDSNASSVIELGGAGEIRNADFRVTDVPLRGFWSYYAELMGIEPEGAVR